MEEHFQSLMQKSSNQDLVAQLAEVLKVQPMENLPLSKAFFPGAISSPLAREISLLCPQAFAQGSILLPSLGQQQKHLMGESAAIFATQAPTTGTNGKTVSEGSEADAKQEQENRVKQTKRSHMLKKRVLRSTWENVRSKLFERSKTANKEGSCGVVRLTEKEKWEATKAEWIKTANLTKTKDEGGLMQRKPPILKSLVLDLSEYKNGQ